MLSMKDYFLNLEISICDFYFFLKIHKNKQDKTRQQDKL